MVNLKAKAKTIRLQFDDQGSCEFVLTMDMLLKEAIGKVYDLKQAAAAGKTLDVEIKKPTGKRSTKANAFLWKLITEIAVEKKCSREDVYLNMLMRYGVSAHIIARPEAVDRLQEGWRFCRVAGETDIGGKKGVHLQCFFGSHLYNADEFSALLNGVKAEAAALGISDGGH